MKKFLVFVAFVAMVLIVSPVFAAHSNQEGGPAPTATNTPIPLIIGIGQSNMAGQAPLPAVTMTALPPGAVMLHWDATTQTWGWVPMKEPSDIWNDQAPRTQMPATGVPSHTPTPFGTVSISRYGPASAFVSKLMTAKGWTKVAFINCGVGGSPVSSWAPDTAWAKNADNFNDCWVRISNAISNNYYEVAGVIIVNGETESNNTPGPSQYSDDMNKLYNALVTRLNKPGLPVAYLMLGEAPPSVNPSGTPVVQRPQWYAVRTQQTSLPNGYPTNNWRVASAWGITREANDYLHYAQPTDYDLVGVRLANAFLTALPTPTITPTATRTPTQTPTQTPTP